MSLATLVPLLLLLAINAFYVAAEFSIVAAQRSQLVPLARSGDRRAGWVLDLLADAVRVDRFIAACQVGITSASLSAGALTQAVFAERLANALGKWFSLPRPTAVTASFVALLVGLTLTQVIFCELLPKAVALQFPESTARNVFVPMRWSTSLFRPLIALLNGTGLLILRPFGVRQASHQHAHSPAEIRLLVDESRREGTLSAAEHHRIHHGLHFAERRVRQMMTPRSELYAIDIATPPEQVPERIMGSPFSRIPVYEGTLDRIVGAVSVKELVGLFCARGRVPPLRDLVKPIPFIPEGLRAHRVIRFLQERQSSKAVVVDEFGGVQGIISMEDVLGHLLGHVGDELKEAIEEPVPLADGSIRFPASMLLDDVRPVLPLPWEDAGSTLGGHIVNYLGRLPHRGERVELNGVEVKIVDMAPTAIRSVALRLLEAEPGKVDDEEAAEP